MLFSVVEVVGVVLEGDNAFQVAGEDEGIVVVVAHTHSFMD